MKFDCIFLLDPDVTSGRTMVEEEWHERAGDLERLEQVVALKFVVVLEEKRRLLDRAIGAIREAEAALQSGGRPHTAVLKKSSR
jgi:hypothetical protein